MGTTGKIIMKNKRSFAIVKTLAFTLAIFVISPYLQISISNAVFANEAGAPSFNGYRRPFVEITPRSPAPVTPIITSTGGITNISRYSDQVILINFWATWCAVCLDELPSLDRLKTDFDGAPLAILTLSFEPLELQPLKAYFDRLSISQLNVARDPDGVSAKALGVNYGLPYSFIIDKNGNLAGYLAGGADWDSPEARRLIRYFIDE